MADIPITIVKVTPETVKDILNEEIFEEGSFSEYTEDIDDEGFDEDFDEDFYEEDFEEDFEEEFTLTEEASMIPVTPVKIVTIPTEPPAAQFVDVEPLDILSVQTPTAQTEILTMSETRTPTETPAETEIITEFDILPSTSVEEPIGSFEDFLHEQEPDESDLIFKYRQEYQNRIISDSVLSKKIGRDRIFTVAKMAAQKIVNGVVFDANTEKLLISVIG